MAEIDLNDLADRVEALQGPCRETDAAIMGLFTHSVESDDGDYWYGPHDQMPIRVPDFTGSLDAAAALVPEGWEGRLIWTHNLDGKMVHYVKGHGGHKGYGGPHYASPALALTAACLRARTAALRARLMEGEGEK